MSTYDVEKVSIGIENARKRKGWLPLIQYTPKIKQNHPAPRMLTNAKFMGDSNSPHPSIAKSNGSKGHDSKDKRDYKDTDERVETGAKRFGRPGGIK